MNNAHSHSVASFLFVLLRGTNSKINLHFTNTQLTDFSVNAF
jgi:hypothetical protein